MSEKRIKGTKGEWTMNCAQPNRAKCSFGNDLSIALEIIQALIYYKHIAEARKYITFSEEPFAVPFSVHIFCHWGLLGEKALVWSFTLFSTNNL